MVIHQRYNVISRIGKGEMTTTWLAEDLEQKKQKEYSLARP